MNREIKFRAWDKKDKRMVYYDKDCSAPCLSLNGVLQKIIMTSIPMGPTIPIHGNVSHRYDLMQFTGLRDKHNKPIFEGDIVDCNGVGHVVYIDCGFYIQWEEGTWDCLIENCEVIGNVRQSPELLEEDK